MLTNKLEPQILICEAVRQGLAVGGQVMVEPMEVPYARVAVLRDPWGATFTVSQLKPPA